MDLLAEYASDSESSSSTSDGNERETVNTNKDLNAGTRTGESCNVQSGGCETISYKKIVCRGRCLLFTQSTLKFYTEITVAKTGFRRTE